MLLWLIWWRALWLILWVPTIASLLDSFCNLTALLPFCCCDPFHLHHLFRNFFGLMNIFSLLECMHGPSTKYIWSEYSDTAYLMCHQPSIYFPNILALHWYLVCQNVYPVLEVSGPCAQVRAPRGTWCCNPWRYWVQICRPPRLVSGLVWAPLSQMTHFYPKYEVWSKVNIFCWRVPFSDTWRIIPNLLLMARLECHTVLTSNARLQIWVPASYLTQIDARQKDLQFSEA